MYKTNKQDNKSLNIKMDILDIINNKSINNEDNYEDDNDNYEDNYEDDNYEDDNYEDNFIQEYINSLNEQELIVLQIAKKQLESSFDISKSIGFLNWLNKNNLDN